jgi:hypothetical protein
VLGADVIGTIEPTSVPLFCLNWVINSSDLFASGNCNRLHVSLNSLSRRMQSVRR